MKLLWPRGGGSKQFQRAFVCRRSLMRCVRTADIVRAFRGHRPHPHHSWPNLKFTIIGNVTSILIGTFIFSSPQMFLIIGRVDILVEITLIWNGYCVYKVMLRFCGKFLARSSCRPTICSTQFISGKFYFKKTFLEYFFFYL